uniref:Uncharacterized protein n=1 Tax=Globisporangium ultimum (strain ATCC 200006 / CBS 805.95 / DAOM BR144) TaxID=431595 RepID=K3W684_GLOUD
MDTKMDLVERVSYISSATKGKEDGDYTGVKTPGDIEGGALRAGGAPNPWGRDYIGLLIQYMAVGMIYGTLPGTVYPFLLNYLNMEGTQVVSARVLLNLPWSFKVVYGILSDCFPIFGYRRRPFMMIVRDEERDRGFKVTNADIKSDTHEVRWDVTYVLIIRYVVNLLGLCFLPLLPSQKAQTQELKRNGGKSKYLGAFTVFYVIFALCWSVMVNVMSIYPSTKCLKLVGGNGCKK